MIQKIKVEKRKKQARADILKELDYSQHKTYKIDKTKPVKVDLGCGLLPYAGKNGDEIEQWVHQDAHVGPHIEIVCDWENIPIESGIVDEVYSSNTIEHIKPWRYDQVLGEWNRIMKIGCKVYTTTPNFSWICHLFANGQMGLREAQMNLYGDGLDIFHNHFITFTKETLTEVLTKYGFGDIDFSLSPGDPNIDYWWLICTFVKIKNL